MKRLVSLFLLMVFCCSNLSGYGVFAQTMSLPQPGTMLNTSEQFAPVTLRGMKFDAQNPFKFSFILDEGSAKLSDEELKETSRTLIRYFLAALTTPGEDMWVNLSPYERDRVLPDSFAATDLGNDMLAQDYLLKQLASSLTYPESELGKKYWQAVNNSVIASEAKQSQSFSKVWIVPDLTQVYEDGTKVMIAQSTLKVLSDEDYLARQADTPLSKISNLKFIKYAPAADAFKNLIIPSIEKEVNEGKNFAQFRQLHSAVILAAWFKNRLKDSIYQALYIDKQKTNGIEAIDPQAKEKIFNQYVEAFKKGAYNYTQEQRFAQKITKRNFFSGGAVETIAVAGNMRVGIAPVSEQLTVTPSLVADGGTQVDVRLTTKDFEISSDGSQVVTRREHLAKHGNISQIIQKLTDELERIFGKINKKSLYSNGVLQRGVFEADLYAFVQTHGVVRNGMKLVKTDHGEVRITQDGILVIVDDRFSSNHAGRDRLSVYAKDEQGADHELSELRGWIKVGEKMGLVGAGDARLLGTRLRQWMNGEREHDVNGMSPREELEFYVEQFCPEALNFINDYLKKHNEYFLQLEEYRLIPCEVFINLVAQFFHEQAPEALKPFKSGKRDVDFFISSRGSIPMTREDHQGRHDNDMQNIFRDIAGELSAAYDGDKVHSTRMLLGGVVQRDAREYDFYRFVSKHGVARGQEKYITTSDGELRITHDSILVVVNRRFARGHVGRGRLCVYARNEQEAQNLLYQLREWTKVAKELRLVGDENVSQFGDALQRWMADDPARRDKNTDFTGNIKKLMRTAIYKSRFKEGQESDAAWREAYSMVVSKEYTPRQGFIGMLAAVIYMNAPKMIQEDDDDIQDFFISSGYQEKTGSLINSGSSGNQRVFDEALGKFLDPKLSENDRLMSGQTVLSGMAEAVLSLEQAQKIYALVNDPMQAACKPQGIFAVSLLPSEIEVKNLPSKGVGQRAQEILRRGFIAGTISPDIIDDSTMSIYVLQALKGALESNPVLAVSYELKQRLDRALRSVIAYPNKTREDLLRAIDRLLQGRDNKDGSAFLAAQGSGVIARKDHDQQHKDLYIEQGMNDLGNVISNQDQRLRNVSGKWQFREFLSIPGVGYSIDGRKVYEFSVPQGSHLPAIKGALELTTDGILVVTYDHFKGGHGSPDNLAVYAKTPEEAAHELSELRAVIQLGIDLKIITKEDRSNLGKKLTRWMNSDSGKLIDAEKTELLRAFVSIQKEQDVWFLEGKRAAFLDYALKRFHEDAPPITSVQAAQEDDPTVFLASADDGKGVGGINEKDLENSLKITIKGDGTRVPIWNNIPLTADNFTGFDFTIDSLKRK